MKKLLMATDLSARSDRALERAVRLAIDHNGHLTVVHVVDEDLPAPLADAQKSAAEQAIHEHLDDLTSNNGMTISIEVPFGRAYVDILEMAEKTDADMIVLGVHRNDSFKDMFRGTTAERVIRAGNAPVLLVKDRVRTSYQQIMVGIDFSVYSRRAVEFAIRFVPAGHFHLVHAYDMPFSSLLPGREKRHEISKQHELQFQEMVAEEMAAFLSTVDATGPRLETVMEQGVVLDVIQRQVDGLKPDLLVVGTHGRTGVVHALLGSVANDLLKDPPCDVLAVNAW
ncbi:MAG: universal stress protein [Pseudomonadota bacterium]